MKTKLCIRLGLSLILLTGIAVGCRQNSSATIQETREVIKTYPYSEPDPVPILTRSSLWGRGGRLYPYTFIDGYSKDPVDQEWTVVKLENPYVDVSILPEVGGKIWGASEKSTGQEFIYKNHVMKFREIALRGPWTSGGIEFNFGIVGHTPSGAHPVDYLVRKNPDGSVSCIVGNLDLPSRTRWTVAVTVPPDKAYFETQASWFNPTALHQSYYVWMNGAIRVSDDLEYSFPGSSHIAHNFAVPLRPWPVDENGRNLAWYKNNDFGSYKSYFTVGEYEDFFGGYWHDSRFGFGHWARYDDVPGQKIWIWGLSRQGMIWEDLLTDSDGQYSEPQAGRYLNQNDHAVFVPQAADRWREVWFPYKEIGPLSKASPQAALHVEYTDGGLQIGVCALEFLREDLTVVSEETESEIHRESLELSPMETSIVAVPVEGGDRGHIVHLGDQLVYYTDPGKNDLKRPIQFQQFHGKNLTDLFLQAERMFQERNYYQALQNYRHVLDKEPHHLTALARVAELHLRRGEKEAALGYAAQALKKSMYDPLSNYIYAVAARRSGMLLDAKETLGWASRSLEYRSSAYSQMAEIHLIESNPELALEYAHRAVDYNTYNVNAYQVAAVAHRLLGDQDTARKVLAVIQEIDPLHHFSRFETYLLKPENHSLAAFQNLIRNEYPVETYLELAIYYVSLARFADALQLLKLAPEHPMVNYWQAWILKDTHPGDIHPFLERAQGSSPELVFPFREESIPVLEWVIDLDTQAWKPKYYLGLLLWSKGRVEEALPLLEECGEPDFAPFYLARAYFYREKNPERALQDYTKGAVLDQTNWRNTHRLMEFKRQLGMDETTLQAAREAAQRFPDSIPIRMEMVRALMALSHYQEAAELLDTTTALPSEGATAIHALFKEAHIRSALASIEKKDISQAILHLERSQEYPENLGTGKPYTPDVRLQQYLLALCHSRVGERQTAQALFDAIEAYTLGEAGETGPYRYFGGLVLRDKGLVRKARELMRNSAPEQAVLDALRKLR
jgi:tetratricopeptide (TPR) repeat protein